MSNLAIPPQLVRSSKYEVTRRQVIVEVPSIPNSSIQIHASTFAPPHEDMTEEPRMMLPYSQITSREQWEEVKRLGDEAWARFEKDHWDR